MHLESRKLGGRARLVEAALLLLFIIGFAGTARGAEGPVPFDGEKSSWHGFDRYDLFMDEQTLEIKPAVKGQGAAKGQRQCIVVVPKKAAPGSPWSWRGCYWDHEPQAEVELLKRGFHIAFIAPDAGAQGKVWDAWYKFLTEKHGLAKKAAFIGMSKGGVNEFNWGVVNPDKVACIYADNPALYDEDFAKLPALAKHDVPLLHVCGTEDMLLQRHTRVVEDTYHQLGGQITVIVKEGHAHHPHSLQNPKPIADWIEQHMTRSTANRPAFVDEKFTKGYYYSLEPSFIYLKEEDTYATARGPGITACYDRYDGGTSGTFKTGGMSIIVPKTVAPGKPWVFTGDPIERDATVEQALLAKGYHIVILPPTGSGMTRKQWDDAHKLLVDNGFSNKPVLKGTGAMAGEAYAWAVANPGKVSCIYARNPLMKSLMAGKEQPIDNLAALAKAGVPVLHDCGALDPWLDKQTRVVEKRYKELDGKITVIVREGEGHFPLSPKDPKSVVDFIVKNTPIPVKGDAPTSLYGGGAASTDDCVKKQAGDSFRWTGSGQITWKVQVDRAGDYEVALNHAAEPDAVGQDVQVSSGNSKVGYTLAKTKGVFGNKSYEMTPIKGPLRLEAGAQSITLSIPNAPKTMAVLDFRSLELVPVAANAAIEAERKEARRARASTEWLAKAGYGLMFHWTSQSVGKDGTHKPYARAVDDFDVKRFAEMVEETGAGYVILTIGHAESYCPAPLKAWEKYHPGKTTQRDLIADMADALNAKGIKLMCYLNAASLARYPRAGEEEFTRIMTEVVTEFGQRYKEKVAGYWFDCFYQAKEKYPGFSFPEFFKACKAGNPNRIVALNSWIYPNVSEWQEYWAGETASPVALPLDGSTQEHGPGAGLRYHALLIMEPYWVQQKAEMPKPRFTAEQLGDYISQCKAKGGAVTINLGIYQDGTVDPNAVDVLKEVRTRVGLAGTTRAAGQYVEVKYPASTAADGLQVAVTYTIWIPDGVGRLRGIIVHQHGAGTTASKEGSTAAYDLHWQALAKKWDCALLGPSYHVLNEKTDITPGGSELWFDPRRGSEKTFLKALDDLAAKSEHAELKTVPWALWGHSGGGIWSDVMATLHPDRVLAVWMRSGTALMFLTHAEFTRPKVPDALAAIPMMCNPGVKEKPMGQEKPEAEDKRTVEEKMKGPWLGSLATFKEYRAKGVPIGLAPDPRTGHECGDSRYLAIPFLDACLAMRLPDKGAKDQALKPIDQSKAWLAPVLCDTAQPAADFKGNAKEAVWLPNEAVAKAWMEYVKTGAVSDTTPPPAPFNVKATYQAEKGVEITWNAEADLESGIRGFLVLRDGQELAQVPEKPVGRFGRPLFQSMTYHDTPSQPLSQMRYLDTSSKIGEKYAYTVIAVNSVGLKSKPSASSAAPKALPPQTPPAQPSTDGKDMLQPDEEKVIRAAVYKDRPHIGSSFELNFQSRLLLPKALTGLYEKRPEAIMELLLKIMEGASPDDSVLAAGYALSLLDGPGVGVVCIEVFEKDTYDTVRKAWKMTPRNHWINKVKTAMEKKKK